MKRLMLYFIFLLVPGASKGQIVAWQFGNPASTGGENNFNTTTNNHNLEQSV